jgi:hypothetical protein
VKVLLFDIETAPMEAFIWSTGEQYIGHDQIKEDWSVLAWCAKWHGSKELIYEDNRNSKNIRDDKRLLKNMWKLLDEADAVITQNGRSFDAKKLNARFEIFKMGPPSSYKHEDTKVIAKKHFGFSSYSLEYMAKVLNLPHQKLKHKKYPGRELWLQCLERNISAWNEMERYNKHDVLTLEDLYERVAPWGGSLNPNLYTENSPTKCFCGSSNFEKRGFFYSPTGKFQRYKCKSCGAETRSKINLFTQEKRLALKAGAAR